MERTQMKISNNGLALIKRYEGCRLTAYRDAVGIPTIGYGHTKGVKMGQTITEAQATAYLLEDVAKSEDSVNKYVALYNFNQDMFDALVSFTFNCGVGNFRKLIDNGLRSAKQISEALPLYNKAGGKVLAGLTRRRNEEKALFDRGLYGESKPAVNGPQVLKNGSRGQDVKCLQTLLNEHGYNLDVDGIFGKKTEQALKDFQAKNIDACKMVDGICGRLTWSALSL